MPAPGDPGASPRWWTGWLPLLVLPGAAWLLIPPAWPPWALMWALAGAMYAGFKWLTWRRTLVSAPPWRHAAYLLAWPGMDAASFLDASSPPPARPAGREWLLAVARLAAGILLLYGLARLITNCYAAGWVGMVGLTMILHFGAFHLLSCLWRQAAINAPPLMNRPLRSRSISEFWGKRWNTPFRDLTHRFLFRPAVRRLAMPVALLAAFAASGLVHELVISVPAGAGYGGPTLFFLLQAGAILAERSAAGRRAGLGGGWRGRLFAAVVLLLPAVILFHPPFVNDVVVPFLRAIGAL